MDLKIKQNVVYLSNKLYEGKSAYMSLELYTKNNCIQCKMTKSFLTQHHISFEEKNINTNPEYIDYLKDKGFHTVPVLEEDNQAIIRGFRPDLLKKIVAQ